LKGASVCAGKPFFMVVFSPPPKVAADHPLAEVVHVRHGA
jgi:hypothetical protein